MAKTTTSPAEPAAVQESTEDKKFLLGELGKNCVKLFGVTSSTFAGATADLTEAEYSAQEVKQHIEAWKKKEVK
jgi:hypothetical protein